jgi:NADH-quinone oxidoreductase subunit J
MIQTFAFYLFAVMVIASGSITILARNPVHSVLWLIVAFFNGAGLMVLLGAEFIAMLLVIVYVGAVAVLFLFVVMMLGMLIALVLLAELVLGVGAYRAGAMHLGTAPVVVAAAPGVSNIEAIGALLYGQYLFLFEAAGIILLVAMIGAIVLTHRGRKDTRPQNVSRQNQRRPQDATRNVSPPVGEGVQW